MQLLKYISKYEKQEDDSMEYVTLNNGVKMPILGYGVYQTPPEDTERCVLDAIQVGYRSIDTAQAYGNKEGVGNAIEKCGLPSYPDRYLDLVHFMVLKSCLGDLLQKEKMTILIHLL